MALAPVLRAYGPGRVSRLPPRRVLDLIAPFQHLPARDERFDWTRIAEGACDSWETPEARDEAFRRALDASFPAQARLALVFHTAEYAVVLGMDAALALARTILDACHDTLWVVALGGGAGLVEVSFSEREVCWGARLAMHADATPATP